MASRFILPFADVGSGISPSDGARLFFFESGTSTDKDTFSNETLLATNANPVVANGNGVFPDIFLPDGGRYKVILETKVIGVSGVQEFESDPVVGGLSSNTSISKTFGTVALMIANIEINAGDYVQTLGEVTAGDGGNAQYFVEALATPDEVLDFTSTGVATLQLTRKDRIGTNKTINVPADFVDITAALARIATLRIKNAILTIKVADGTHVETAGIVVNHEDGENLNIIGNTVTPANVILSFPNSFGNVDGIIVNNGHTLGLIDGFRIIKAAKAIADDVGTAVLALNESYIRTGPNMETNNWYYGFAARLGSVMFCNGVTVDNAGDVGIWAFVGSTIDAQNATSTNAADVANNLGFGFQSEYGSALDCSGGTASGCRIGGIAALSNSQTRALNSTTSTNTGSGYFAQGGGFIEANGGTANNNTRHGVEELDSSRVLATSLTTTGNTISNIKPVAILDNTGLGPRLVPNVASALRIDSLGAFPVFFNTGGGLQFEVGDVVSAVNHIIAFGGATGSPALLQVTGSDANIDLELAIKGTGRVRLGPRTASGDVAINGFVEVKDSAGVVRKLATIA